MQIQPPPEKFLSTLLEIRNYYAPLVDKYGKLYREALDNLTHVEALLSNWPLTVEMDSNGSTHERREEILTLPEQKPSNGNPVASKTKPESKTSNNTKLVQVDNTTTESILAQSQEDIHSSLDEKQAATLAEENLSNGSSKNVSLDENKSDEVANAPQAQAINSEIIAKGESETKDDIDSTLEVGTELVKPMTSESSPQKDEPPVAESTKQEEITTTPDKSLYGQEIPMLEEYRSLRRIEAVEQLLHKHIGSVCHIDFIVRSLYGELEPKAWKVVKGRVQSTLTQGRESQKWSLVPGKPGYYTIDLKLLNSKRKESSSKPSQTKLQKPDPKAKANLIPMKGEFAGKFLIDAISLLLEQNPRKVFDVAEVINRLYGKLSPEQLLKVRPGVLNELSRGYRSGRFSRVPEEKGLYIWDSKLLPD